MDTNTNTDMQETFHGGVIYISFEALIDLLQLPEQWKVMGTSLEPMRRAIAIAVSHESLPIVPECEDLPRIEPHYRRKNVQELPRYAELTNISVWDASTGKSIEYAIPEK